MAEKLEISKIYGCYNQKLKRLLFVFTSHVRGVVNEILLG